MNREETDRRALRKPRRHSFVRLKERFGRRIVVMPETAFLLGGSGAQILDLCDGFRSDREIARTIAQESSGTISEGAVEQEVIRFLDQMEALGVLEPSDETTRGAD